MSKKLNESFMSEKINTEIERRIEEMESESYVFPERLRAVDYVGFALLMLACAAVVVGLMLCCSAL